MYKDYNMPQLTLPMAFFINDSIEIMWLSQNLPLSYKTINHFRIQS